MAHKYFFILLLLASCFVISCSGGDETTSSGKGRIEKLTDATADRVVTGINSSLDAARNAGEQLNADTKEKEKMLQQAGE